jgi:hypothetical protein
VVVAAGWEDRGTAPAVQARDSAWAAVEDQAAGERVAVAEQVVVEPAEVAAQALQVAAGAVVPVCGIRVGRVGRVAVVAQGQARVAPVVEVGPAAEVEVGLAVEAGVGPGLGEEELEAVVAGVVLEEPVAVRPRVPRALRRENG